MEGACHPEGGRPVASEAQRRVVILYEHALLGEGIAKYLRAQLGVKATVASALDLQAVASALALGPGVVIFESGEALQSLDLTALAPDAVLIDVSTVVARGLALAPDAAALHRILRAVGESSASTAPADQRRPNPGE
jgi:hypothetical protein